MKINKIELDSTQKKANSKLMLGSWVQASLNNPTKVNTAQKGDSKRYFEIQSTIELKMIRKLRDKNK